MEKQSMVIVPAAWFETLLKDALDFENAQKDWEYGSIKNDRIHLKAVILMGYAKSASSILNHNERIEK